MQWILASASPRRKELFAELIEQFEIIPAQGEEVIDKCLSPDRLVQSLAEQKAMEVAMLERAKGKYILGADTVVALQGEILGKPKDKQDAIRILQALSGNTHEVLTGICIVYHDGNQARILKKDVEKTEVVFTSLSYRQIEEYVDSGSPMDKAGAYGIQDGGLVQKIKGSYSNVVGLPMELLQKRIKEIRAGTGTR